MQRRTGHPAEAIQPPGSTHPNLYSDDGPGETLHYLMHDVRLLFDTDLAQAQEYELVKIAELLRAPDGQGAVLSTYVPPALAVHASPVLTSLLKAVRDQLTAKGRELAEYQQQCGNLPSALGPRETVALVMRQTLNRYIPLVQHYLEIEETHPCALRPAAANRVGSRPLLRLSPCRAVRSRLPPRSALDVL